MSLLHILSLACLWNPCSFTVQLFLMPTEALQTKEETTKFKSIYNYGFAETTSVRCSLDCNMLPIKRDDRQKIFKELSFIRRISVRNPLKTDFMMQSAHLFRERYDIPGPGGLDCAKYAPSNLWEEERKLATAPPFQNCDLGSYSPGPGVSSLITFVSTVSPNLSRDVLKTELGLS
mmetsp:Transcript_2716/g.3723  ORF Transcript_2716/g.3723 Transcript_2716/m.3723 type:complete len:176 (+) Transcript_2716:695-1222(+)